MSLCHRARTALARAIYRDHQMCSSYGCEIYMANSYHYPITAARLLLNSTSEDMLHIDQWCDTYGLDIPENLEDCEDYDGWQAYVRAHSVTCESCGGITYLDSPTYCAHCDMRFVMQEPERSYRNINLDDFLFPVYVNRGY